jgi:hypothetical protein
MIGKYIEKTVTPKIGEFRQFASEQDGFELPPVVTSGSKLETDRQQTPGK